MLDPAFGYSIVVSMAILFAGAGVHKLRGLAHFTEIFTAYRVLPDVLGRRLALLIPCMELSVAICLFWAPRRSMAAIPAITVLIAYAAGLGINLLRGRRDLDCGCGAAHNRRAIAPWMVWRNLLLAAALGFAALPWSSRPVDWIDWLTIMGGVTVGVTLYVAVDRLLGEIAPKATILRSTS